jgi:hypothetical protein
MRSKKRDDGKVEAARLQDHIGVREGGEGGGHQQDEGEHQAPVHTGAHLLHYLPQGEPIGKY